VAAGDRLEAYPYIRPRDFGTVYLADTPNIMLT
jgi:hypothetical protein